MTAAVETLTRARILIVDDEPANVLFLERLLERGTVDAFATCMGRLRDAGVAAVLVADWHELTRGVDAEGLDRFVAIRPTLASAIDAIRGQSA